MKGTAKGIATLFIGIMFLFAIYSLIVGVGTDAPLPTITAICDDLGITVYELGQDIFIVGLMIVLLCSFIVGVKGGL